MKKFFALLIVCFITLTFTVAYGELVPYEDFSRLVNYHSNDERISLHVQVSSQVKLHEIFAELADTLYAVPNLAISEKYILYFFPDRFPVSDGKVCSIECKDSLYIYDRETNIVTEYGSCCTLNLSRLEELNKLFEGNKVPNDLFMDYGFYFDAFAPEKLYEYMLETYSFVSASPEEVFDIISDTSSHTIVSSDRDEFASMMRTYLDPMGEGEGEVDCFAFSSEYAIIYLNYDEAIMYNFNDETLERLENLKLHEFNQLAENCTRLYYQ